MGTEIATVEGIQPVPTVNVNEAIQDRLKQFILEKKLAAGDRLPPEGRLAGSLGVSRPALREALRALEALGTLEVKVGSGWYVRAFSFDSVTKGLAYNLELSQYTFADLSQIRVGLECGFIDDAMRSLTPDTLRNLEQIVTAMEEAAQAGEGYLYTEKDRRFHQTLFADVENPLLDKLMVIFWTRSWLEIPIWPAGGCEKAWRNRRSTQLIYREPALKVRDAAVALADKV